MTKMEKFKIAGSKYVPSILIGSATLACIFGANFRTWVTTKDANFVFGEDNAKFTSYIMRKEVMLYEQ